MRRLNVQKQKKYVIGIDEVGRGALAGPVVVAAVMVREGSCVKCGDGSLRDSKKLSPKQREAWCAHFKNGHQGITFAIARIYPRSIEKMNISKAANLAAARACGRLIKDKDGKGAPIFLDGGLYLVSRASQMLSRRNAQTVVKADEKIPAVSIASIIAKVDRDAYMKRLAKAYPGYGFEVHKGYGTKAHYAALLKAGPSRVHRLTFLTKHHIISQ